MPKLLGMPLDYQPEGMLYLPDLILGDWFDQKNGQADYHGTVIPAAEGTQWERAVKAVEKNGCLSRSINESLTAAY